MKFVFEVVRDIKNTRPSTWMTVRKLFLCFENMVNTTFPSVRVHLKEE